MRYQLLFLLIIFSTSFIHSEKQIWTIHDVHKKRHWKIISYERSTDGYTVLMKQVRNYIISKVNNGTIKANMNYKFCNEYRYIVPKKKPEYDLTHEFFSRFGNNKNFEYYTEFNSNMETINPYFENFMREMLGISQKKMDSDTKKKPWKYKPKPFGHYWTITNIKTNPNGYELYWKSTYDLKRKSLLFKYSEKHFLLKKVLKKIPKDQLIQEYWTTDESPHYSFNIFLATSLNIKKKDMKYFRDKGEYHGFFSESILSNLDESKYPLKLEFNKILKQEKPKYFTKIHLSRIIGIYDHHNSCTIIYQCHHPEERQHSKSVYLGRHRGTSSEFFEYLQKKRSLEILNSCNSGIKSYLHDTWPK